MAAHTEMRRSLDQFKASGRLRPYTPLAITLDKADRRMPLTAAEIRSANRVYSAEVQEAQQVAAEARAHEIMAEMRELSARMQSAGLPRQLLSQPNRRTSMPTGEDSWGFANPGEVPVREPEQAGGPTRRQSRARRIATPELFNRLSIESASTSWANETTGSLDEKWTSLGLGSSDRRQADLLEAGCTRVVQILDPGTASPPANVLRTTLVAIAEPMMAQVEQLLIDEDTEGAIATQQRLVLRLAQRHLCGRREGWLADGEAESAELLQQQVSQAVRWQLSAATSEAAVAAGLAPRAPAWLQQAAELTAERGLWDDDDVRRELRAAIFEAFSRSAAAKGRTVAAQKWLRKAVHLIDGMSIAMGGRKTELGAAAHLNLCATLSAGAKHAEAVQHALSAREQLLFRLGISTELPEQLDEEVYSEMSRGSRAQLPNVKDSKIFIDTMNHIREAVKQEDAENVSVNGAGQRVGQLLAAAYHNCAVQQEALGEIPAALASITVAVSLAQDTFEGDGREEVAQRKQYQRTHRMMRKAALNKPWTPPPTAPPKSDGASTDAAKPADQPTAPVFAVQSEPSILRHRRRTRGSVAGGRRRASPKRNATGKVALAPLNPGLVHKRQSLEMFKAQGTLRPYTPDAILLNKPLSTEPPNTPPKDVPADLSVSADYLSHVLGLGDSEGRPSTAVVLAEAKSLVLRESDKREELASEVRETTYRRSPSPTRRGTAPLFPPTISPLDHPPWNRGPGNTNLSRAEFNASKRPSTGQEKQPHAESPGPSWLSQHPSSGLQLAVAESAGSGQALPGALQAKVASEFTRTLIESAFMATADSPSQA